VGAGFGLVVASGMVGLGAKWVRKIIGEGLENE